MTPPPEKGTYYAHPPPPLSLDFSAKTKTKTCDYRGACISKDDWTKGRGSNESIKTKAKQNKTNVTPEKYVMTSANQTPGGHKFAPLVANQQGRANQHEPACFGLSSPWSSRHVRYYIIYRYFRENLNASKPSNQSKRLGGITIGCNTKPLHGIKRAPRWWYYSKPWVNSTMSGRSPPLYYTLTLIVRQGHQTKSKNKTGTM